MQKRTITIQLPAITARWLKEYLISPTTFPPAALAESGLQKAIVIMVLSSVIGTGGKNESPDC